MFQESLKQLKKLVGVWGPAIPTFVGQSGGRLAGVLACSLLIAVLPKIAAVIVAGLALAGYLGGFWDKNRKEPDDAI